VIAENTFQPAGGPFPPAFTTVGGLPWRELRELACVAVGEAPVPPGFVRRRLPLGERQVEVCAGYAGGTPEEGGTVVVLIAAREEEEEEEWLSPEELRAAFGFTPREAEVAAHLARRRTNKEIAKDLAIAPRTATRHTERVMRKLNTNSRRDVRRVLLGRRGYARFAPRPRNRPGRSDG
jgi:DNA-binding CsgD family transcriptional regulator